MSTWHNFLSLVAFTSESRHRFSQTARTIDDLTMFVRQASSMPTIRDHQLSYLRRSRFARSTRFYCYLNTVFDVQKWTAVTEADQVMSPAEMSIYPIDTTPWSDLLQSTTTTTVRSECLSFWRCAFVRDLCMCFRSTHSRLPNKTRKCWVSVQDGHPQNWSLRASFACLDVRKSYFVASQAYGPKRANRD